MISSMPFHLRQLETTLHLLGSTPLHAICKTILNDEQFKICTASRKQHQAYPGGLVVHTDEVMEISLRMANADCLNVNLNILIPAIIYHDYGKIFDYQKLPTNPITMSTPLTSP